MKHSIKSIFLAALFTLSFLTSALAQTPFQGTPPPPIPESKVQQTQEHHEGSYTSMNRRQLKGGEIQEAWDEADEFEGIWNYNVCQDCTFKVRLRHFMVTVVRLPEGEKITAVDVGDPANFKTKVRNPSTLAIKPSGFGGDTNMIVYGENNRVYAFYLRAESVNSNNVPDMVVNIRGNVSEEIILPDEDGEEKQTALSKEQSEAISDLAPDAYLETDQDDFVEHIAFDPDKLHGWGDYKLWGDDELRPETVYRDDHFTYVKFTKEQWAEIELPTAYTVIDDIDELVNTHIKGTTYVIESTSKLISFKSGQKFLCIEYEG